MTSPDSVNQTPLASEPRTRALDCAIGIAHEISDKTALYGRDAGHCGTIIAIAERAIEKLLSEHSNAAGGAQVNPSPVIPESVLEERLKEIADVRAAQLARGLEQLSTLDGLQRVTDRRFMSSLILSALHEAMEGK